MPSVSLLYHTGQGYGGEDFAARLLAFTKNTRLNMSPGGFAAFLTKPQAEIAKEMAYMATTIPSSWEFVDVIFLMSNVSRSTAQQVTRTRTATFAMQSQRVTNMSDVTWDKVVTGDESLDLFFDAVIEDSISAYSAAVAKGMPLEDAREMLPIGVHCNLVAKYNLRTLVELCQKRDSLRVQGPYVEIVRQMKEAVLEVWPWVEPFFKPKQQTSIEMIEEVARELAAMEGEKGAMYKGLSGRLAKAADLLKG